MKIKCPSCDTNFSQRKTLYSHVRKFHDKKLLSDLLPAKDSSCRFCDKKFSNKKSLYTHIAKYHPSREKLRSSRIICPYEWCKKKLITFPKLRNHLIEIHEVKIEFDVIQIIFTVLLLCGIAG